MKFFEKKTKKNNLLLIIVDTLASTGAFVGVVCLISLDHVIDWDQAKVIDREGSRVDRWIKEAIHIRKEQDKSNVPTLPYLRHPVRPETERQTAIRQTVLTKAPVEAKTSTIIDKRLFF